MSLQLRSHRRRFLLPFGSVYALCATLAMPAVGQDAAGGGSQDPQVEVTDYGVVDIAVQDADLAQVLQMLSMQARKNIITSKNVSATVTANLYDVTFYEALDSILTVNGFGYEEQGNFIYVYTKEELEARRKANRKTETRIFELDYLSAQDANEFVASLLSEDGKSSFRGDVPAGIKPDVGDVGADGYAFAAKVVVTDYPENLEKIASLLAELDTPAQQVLVEATILQTSVNEANAFGVDFSVLANINFNDVISPLGAVGNLLNGGGEGGVQPADNKAQAVTSTVGNTGGAGGFKVGILTDDIAVFVRMLDEVTDNTILARPRIMALNRQRAEVLVGARVGYLSTTATETTTTQTVEFLDTGIQLVFRPFISKNGMIRLELRPSVSEASLRTVTNADGAGVTIPDELTNELTTNVRVRDGQTMVLGGLFKESTRSTRRQVPLLGDIPIVGAAFRGHDDAVQRDEIIFLITPSIVKDELLWENGEEMLALAEMVRVGARSGLLPFSREKMTANYAQSAMDAANAGDTELALYHINNALRLNPNQPELLAMRQRLTGVDEKHFERSLFERMMDREMTGQQQGGSAQAPQSKTPKRDPLAGNATSKWDRPATPPAQESKPIVTTNPAMPENQASEKASANNSMPEPIEETPAAPKAVERELTKVDDVSFSLEGWDETGNDESDSSEPTMDAAPIAENAHEESDESFDAMEDEFTELTTADENAPGQFSFNGWSLRDNEYFGIWWLLPSLWEQLDQSMWNDSATEEVVEVPTDIETPK